MSVLLISANTETFPEPVFPVGLLYVADALQRSGAEVRVFDMRQRGSLERELRNFPPDSIGVSLRNIDNAAYPFTRFYLPSYRNLMTSIRAVSDAPVILGGAGFSLFPEEIKAYLKADGGVMGEGETALEAFRDPKSGNVSVACPAGLEEVALPRNIAGIFPNFRRYGTIGIQTSRGCSNRCSYCTYPLLEGRRRRSRPPAAVIAEISFLYKDFGIRNFFIVDSIFNNDEGNMVEVLERLSAAGLPIRISCYLQPKLADPSVARLLKKAGCVAVDFGTDSGSDTVLASLGKSFTADDVSKTSLLFQKEGIDFCHSLIFGGPGETAATIRETVSLMDEVSPKAVVAMTGVRIYPGTGIERIALEEGAIPAGESLLGPRFYFSEMGPALLLKEVTEAVGGRRNWFLPGQKDWSASLGHKLLGFFYRKGPLWRTFKK